MQGGQGQRHEPTEAVPDHRGGPDPDGVGQGRNVGGERRQSSMSFAWLISVDDPFIEPPGFGRKGCRSGGGR
jgi:hypothetical protein